MHRASAALPALLMATATAALLVARVHSSATATALQRVNPTLSACDLQNTTDLQGACSTTMGGPATGTGPGPPSMSQCPPPCTPKQQQQIPDPYSNSNNNNTFNQCLLYLEESHKEMVCNHKMKKKERLELLERLRLRHCCEHAVKTVLKKHELDTVINVSKDTRASCLALLSDILEVDAIAARVSCGFSDVLTRYDCGQPYSIVYHCDDCKEAYRRWVCSSLVPHVWTMRDEKNESRLTRVKPCRSVCQTVEQRCPYMLPGDSSRPSDKPTHPTQYAGEPTFLCLDPNIPETGNQKRNSSYGDDDCCYTYCGTPGRPCVHCPAGLAAAATANETEQGRKRVECNPNPSPQKIECRAPGLSSATSSATKAFPSPLQTLHIIQIVYWTTWTMIHNNLSFKTITNILHCSLLMCVQCVRTPLALVKTKWKSRS